jgi:hypothetical protein
MARGKRHQPEQVVNLQRQIEVAVANGKTTAHACKEAEIVEQTYFPWRKEYACVGRALARPLQHRQTTLFAWLQSTSTGGMADFNHSAASI